MPFNLVRVRFAVAYWRQAILSTGIETNQVSGCYKAATICSPE